MKEILEGDFYRMPSGMTRYEMREFIIDVADGRVEPIARRGTYRLTKEKAHKISLNTEQAYLDEYKPLDKVFKLEEFTQL